MKPYDAQREHLTSSLGFAKYPYVVVALGRKVKDQFWDNMHKSYTYTTDNGMGYDETRTIVGYGMSGVKARPEEWFYFFYDKRNLDIFIEENAEAIVTTDPWGPDKCSSCGGPVPEVVEKIVYVEVSRPWWKIWK